MRIVILGPPGAGKGTQARLLSEQRRIPHIATGDLLREAVRARTPIGTEAQRFMERGELVPDELILKIMEERIDAQDARRGCILDGFPRTVGQAQALDKLLAQRGERLNKVIAIRVDDEEIVRRITGRLVCRQCGAMYHIEFDPPKVPGVCDECKGELYQRADDREETVRHRLEVYALETHPLMEFYERQGLLVQIDGAGTIGKVQQRIAEALDSNQDG